MLSYSAALRRLRVASVLAAAYATFGVPAAAGVTFSWAGNNGSPVGSGKYVAFTTRTTAKMNGDVRGPVELWGGDAANPERIIGAGDAAPSVASLTVTSIGIALAVDEDGAVTFLATLSDGSEVLYTGTKGALKVLAGKGPAVEGMTGLLTTTLREVYAVSVNALGISALDGSLWLHAAGKNTPLGTIANGSETAPWSDGRTVNGRLSQATSEGAFAIQAISLMDTAESGREYGIAIGTKASDITMPIPFKLPEPVTGIVATAPVRDAAGNVVFTLTTPGSLDGVKAVELLKDGTQTELARVGDAAPGVAGNITLLTKPSMSSTGRIVFFGKTDQVACAQERSCGTVWTGTPDHLYPAAATGYVLPGTGSAIQWLSLASGINDKGQFVVNAATFIPGSVLVDVALYLYDPSVGFTRLMDSTQGVPEIDPERINGFLQAIPAGDDQFFLDVLYSTPASHNTCILARVTDLTPVGTDIALDPSTFVGNGSTGGTGAGGAATGGNPANHGGATSAGGSRPMQGGASGGGGAGGSVPNAFGGETAGQAADAGTAGQPKPAHEKSSGCAVATPSRQNPIGALGLLAAVGLLALRKRSAARRER